MAWSTPFTAAAGTAFTAAQFNSYIRDNLLETAPAKATTAGRFFAATGGNSIAERALSTWSTVLTSQTETSSSYVDLATVGPAVTATLSANALIFMYCSVANNTAPHASHMAYQVSGATSQTASDSLSMGSRSTNTERVGCTFLATGYTAGSNTWTAKYKVNTTGTGTWDDRRLGVMPF